MMDEIDEDKINNVFKDKENELHSWLDKTTDENSNKNIMLSLKDICREKKETLEIINFSKDIQFLEEDGKVNYHKYFKRLKNKIGNRWFSNYTFTNQPIFMVYRIVSKFNKTRWDEYISPVVQFLESAEKRQTNRFSHDTYNNKRID
ncbi:hypothetical protein MJ61_000755 [Escherichia albertii]|nr:hypothetical protein [Escherichia albertii]